MSPKIEPAQITILPTGTTKPQVNYLSRSGNGHPNRIQWKAPSASFKVQFPEGVFAGGAVNLTVSGDTLQPEPPLELLPKTEQEDEGHAGYVKAARRTLRAMAQAKPKTGPPIIIIRP